MKYYKLEKHTNRATLFEGYYSSFKACLEDAVAKKTDLSEIDLKYRKLNNFNLDTAYMPGADFSHANLTGTNLSESTLSASVFYSTYMHSTCLCESKLNRCDFRGAEFGATLIDGADLCDSTFTTLSSFDLNFTQCKSIVGSKFVDVEGKHYNMSQVPVVIKGVFDTPIVFLDQVIKIGGKNFSIELFNRLLKKQHFADHAYMAMLRRA